MNTKSPQLPEVTIPLMEECRYVADLNRVDPLEVAVSMLALTAGLAGARFSIEGDPAPPPTFSLLLVNDLVRPLSWAEDAISCVSSHQRQQTDQLQACIPQMHDALAIKRDLESAAHLRQFDDLFEEEVRSIEALAALNSRPPGWLFAHPIQTAGPLVPDKGLRRNLLVLARGRKDWIRLAEQVRHPRCLLPQTQAGAPEPAATLFGWVDELVILRAMRESAHLLGALKFAKPLMLPVATGTNAPPGTSTYMLRGLREIIAHRWINLSWAFRPAAPIASLIKSEGQAAREALEEIPPELRPWVEALEALPLQLVASAHLLAATTGRKRCHYGHEDLTVDTLKLSTAVRKRVIQWMQRSLPDQMGGTVREGDLPVLTRIRQQAPIRPRELLRRIRGLTAAKRDATLQRLLEAELVNWQDGYLVPVEEH